MLQKRLHAWVGLWSCEPVGALRVAAALRRVGATGTTAQLRCGPASIEPLLSPVLLFGIGPSRSESEGDKRGGGVPRVRGCGGRSAVGPPLLDAGVRRSQQLSDNSSLDVTQTVADLPPTGGGNRERRIFFFIYLFWLDSRKINDRIKIFEKCTSGAVLHDVKSLPPWGTARQGLNAVGHGGRSLVSAAGA
jgi:hypothetical protein